MNEQPAAAPAKKKNEKLTGWLGTYVVMTVIGVVYSLISIFKNNSEVLSECNGAKLSLVKKFCDEVTGPIGLEMTMIIIIAILAIIGVVLVYKRKKISIPYVIAFEAIVLAWNIIDFAMAMSILGPWGEKLHTDLTSGLVSSLVISIVSACIWIPFFIFSKTAKKELNQ